MMDVIKGPNHSKITGDFAEALVVYWLSKYGFECARIDQAPRPRVGPWRVFVMNEEAF
jgi:hypothetical protein